MKCYYNVLTDEEKSIVRLRRQWGVETVGSSKLEPTIKASVNGSPLNQEPGFSRQLLCDDYSELPVLAVPWLTLDTANVTFHQLPEKR